MAESKSTDTAPAAQAERPPKYEWEDLHDKIVARNRTPLVTESEHGELEFLEICKTIHVRNRGCITPAEEFMVKLVDHYGFHGGLTPEVAEQTLETFCEDFADALEVARRFARVHHALIEQLEPDAA